ncbi:MAG: GNAT family N-acetyltransferase [Candidatus ainarchaeum sp.]|nr:GNAT family N-acetyltransferase [Candidatus ainarchaeum sp.]
MGKKFEGTKLIVRKARAKELEWLINSKEFKISYDIPEKMRKEWPCFVLLQGKKIIGYRSFKIEYDPNSEKTFAWVGSTSLRKGFEGKGLGQFLVGRANSLVHAMKFNELRTHAFEPRAKKFWITKAGFEFVKGKPLTEKGNTELRLNLLKQRNSRRIKRK